MEGVSHANPTAEHAPRARITAFHNTCALHDTYMGDDCYWQRFDREPSARKFLHAPHDYSHWRIGVRCCCCALNCEICLGAQSWRRQSAWLALRVVAGRTATENRLPDDRRAPPLPRLRRALSPTHTADRQCAVACCGNPCRAEPFVTDISAVAGRRKRVLGGGTALPCGPCGGLQALDKQY